MYVRETDICVGNRIFVAASAINNKRWNANTCLILTMINRSIDELRKHLIFSPKIAFRVAPIKQRSVSGRCCNEGQLIEIDCRSSWDKALVTLAHELVHAEQFHEGRLKLAYDNNNRCFLQWKDYNRKNRGTTYKAYRNQPWEVEAWERQNDIAEKVCSALEKIYGE